MHAVEPVSQFVGRRHVERDVVVGQVARGPLEPLLDRFLADEERRVSKDLPVSRNARRDHGRPGRERLERGEAEALVRRGRREARGGTGLDRLGAPR